MDTIRAPRPLPTSWDEPPWGAPLEAPAVIRAIPEDATMSGMFLTAVVEATAQAGAKLEGARPRYTAFHPYPLREHAELLVEAAAKLWPKLPLREGLRRLGRGAPGTLVKSLSGKIVLGSVEGPVEILKAIAKSYAIHTKPGTLEVVELGRGEVVVRLDEVYHFLDCHHVGVFEGVLHFAHVDGHVTLRSYSRVSADLRCSFRAR